jgi:hypothetical protein
MNEEISVSCNMGVFTPSQRDAHIQNTTELIKAIRGIHDIENGYEFSFPDETEIIHKLAEFISLERLCCPFLRFRLQVGSGNEPMFLSLTGPAGTQEFLHMEFEGAFP